MSAKQRNAEQQIGTKASDSRFLSPIFGSFSSAVVNALSMPICDNVCLALEDTFISSPGFAGKSFLPIGLPPSASNNFESKDLINIWNQRIWRNFRQPSLRSVRLSSACFRFPLTAWQFDAPPRSFLGRIELPAVSQDRHHEARRRCPGPMLCLSSR